MPTTLSNGIKLYYEVNGTGQPLVLIHGLGSSTRDWEVQVREFSKTYQVVAFDLRGHGRSDKPAGPYTIPLFAADTAGLLKALGIQSAHIVGISLGGSVAFQFAVDCPAMVKTLTIVNSAPGPFMSEEQFKQEVDRRGRRTGNEEPQRGREDEPLGQHCLDILHMALQSVADRASQREHYTPVVAELPPRFSLRSKQVCLFE